MDIHTNFCDNSFKIDGRLPKFLPQGHLILFIRGSGEKFGTLKVDLGKVRDPCRMKIVLLAVGASFRKHL